MQKAILYTLLLIASASASEVPPSASQVVAQQGPVPVGSSPVVPAVVVNQPPVEGLQVQPNVEQAPQHHHHPQPQHPSVASYYAPAGMMSVVGGEQVGANKPVAGGVRGLEQYGQPESASIPPNYKPFGSWGLYIGGNPADGYYTNYYKALSNSVDKQQVSGAGASVGEQPVKPTQASALGPMLRQAGSSPYGGDYYPFAYSPAEFNSGSRVPVDPQPMHVAPVQHSAQGVVAPVQAAPAQVYGSPASYEPNMLSYADSYATKKLGSAFAQREVKEPPMVAPVQQPQQQAKGYQQSRVAYVYSPVAQMAAIPPAVAPQQQQQPHVVAYPVPVGSQIVGSQPGVEGAFSPYGIHAFTRYAVKPAVVSSDQSYYYSVHSPVSQLPAYKHQQYQTVGQSQVGVQHNQVAYQPLSFYGYPLNQLHYSQGSIVPSGVQQYGGMGESPVVHHSPVQPSQVEAASEKSESEDKSQAVEKQPARQ